MDDEWKDDPDANPELHELLKTLRSYDNPAHDYIGWGPGDDYMSTPRDQDGGWNKNITAETWKEFWHGKKVAEDAEPIKRMEAAGFKDNDWDLNLIADYYFSVTHDSEDCGCYQGYSEEAREVAETFYADWEVYRDETGEFHSNVRRPGWNDQITQDEVQALVDAGRLYDWTHTWSKETGWQRREDGYIPTAEEVNLAQNVKGQGLKSHDAINRGILIDARCKRLGLSTTCERCKGHAYVRTGPDRLVLYLWLLHPRKGASRGVTIRNVQPEDLPEVKELLRASMAQHQKHFAWAMED